jgi:hypothetical protein
MYVCRSMLHSSPLLMCVCGNMPHISPLLLYVREYAVDLFPINICLGICCISPSFTVNAGIIRISFLYFYAYKNMPHLCRIYLLYYYVCRNMPHISPVLLSMQEYAAYLSSIIIMQEYAAYLPSSPAGHHAGPC